MQINKPGLLVAIVIYSVLSGISFLVSSLLTAMLFAFPFITLGMSILMFLISVIGFVGGIALLASAYGLWTLQKWGWQVSLWIYSISIPMGIIAIFPILPESDFSVANTLFQVTFVVIDILCIRYLLQYETKKLLHVFPYL